MHYRKLRDTRPPPLFELQLKAGLARLSSDKTGKLAPAALMPRMRNYVESLLLAKNLPPKVQYIAFFLEKFSELVMLSDAGKPFLYKKKDSVSLLFDVCAIQSEMRLDSPDELVLEYTQIMMGFLLFNSAPQRIAMIGLGGGSLPKYCCRHLSDTSIVVAENDPNVIAMRDDFCVPADDERFTVLCEDGADFVQRSSNQFDVLMVDGFDREGQPAQLCSQQFYDDCYDALAPNGIMVVNLLGDVLETETYLDRIHLSFNGAAITVEDAESFNKIVFACKGSLLNVPDQVLRSRLRNLESQHAVMLRSTMQAILLQRQSHAATKLRA
jgi:spermidine synthase